MPKYPKKLAEYQLYQHFLTTDEQNNCCMTKLGRAREFVARIEFGMKTPLLCSNGLAHNS